MNYPSRVITVLTCCVFTAMAPAGFQCCIAATGNADFDSAPDDSAQVPHAWGNTSLLRFDSLQISLAMQPALDDSIALCIPGLLCSLEVR
ncbi:hypothetical protein [Paraburkholderia dinghuensis]|uniref:Uncharacterized protein n=1 Tax=Paraburkholderia dinghuensis TaxID=2305225 RepID=A0A3N6NAX9_9BURK|nr:hypothetical protein [Paraburkholderia dinghuensis]RQH05497.1 hypothetical protein D1Y85_15740 [Paraburkholderia dinghuensis]